jgi:hypothetical protein
MTLNKQIATIFLIIQLLTGSLYALDDTVLPDGLQSTDSVTVGSRAGFKINYDPVIKSFPSTIMDSSVFDWKFSSYRQRLNYNGKPIVPKIDSFYIDTAISAIMPNTPQTLTLTVRERIRPKIGTSCEGNLQLLPIQVVNRPKIDLVNTSGIPSLSGSFDIPVILKGYGPWEVTVEIKYSDNSTKTIVVDSVGLYTDKPGATDSVTRVLQILPAQFDLDNSYTLTILNVGDRFSKKSLDQDLVKSHADELPTKSYTIVTLPVPKTPKVLHMPNNMKK